MDAEEELVKDELVDQGNKQSNRVKTDILLFYGISEVDKTLIIPDEKLVVQRNFKTLIANEHEKHYKEDNPSIKKSSVLVMIHNKKKLDAYFKKTNGLISVVKMKTTIQENMPEILTNLKELDSDGYLHDFPPMREKADEILYSEENLRTSSSEVEETDMVVTTLIIESNDVMVILDNHLTRPGWCCAENDGNGFFGDKFFDPTVWVAALSKMVATFDGVSNVVGMSLMNEFRGPKQNVNDWIKYMQQGAEAVHSANKNVLVILSGLTFDTDLSFVRCLPVNLSFTGKLVFELHWYSFSDKNSWEVNNPNNNCGQVLNQIENSGGFLLNQGFLLFLSEFGIDKREINANDDRYFGCLTGWAAENDVDWSIWTLTGSYYLRQGMVGMTENYGPGPRTDDYNLVLDPLTGLCLVRYLNDPTKVTWSMQ
ncbi:Glycoside hydrolase family 5 [Arabidopsis suecica]|uniref:Glycoside hydrolase family 5 n=1 Tax=Arabidopsis suecica TaxID=45249 RepID=A0A8T2CJ02_ARASU|nr:Glycoside hydrolase family 5 [Arabidopsis suecica]